MTAFAWVLRCCAAASAGFCWMYAYFLPSAWKDDPALGAATAAMSVFWIVMAWSALRNAKHFAAKAAKAREKLRKESERDDGEDQ
jgi:hypothetical protein